MDDRSFCELLGPATLRRSVSLSLLHRRTGHGVTAVAFAAMRLPHASLRTGQLVNVLAFAAVRLTHGSRGRRMTSMRCNSGSPRRIGRRSHSLGPPAAV